jgi:glycerol-3-phosphate O-acyltransferase / dihydroxyacetone phosphate acyltransferase
MQLTTLITRILGWTAAVFQKVEHSGGPVPPGPVLVVANHPNSLLDPLVIFRVAGRPTRPLAKAPLFRQRFIGTLLRILGGLPVYRAVDDPTQMHRNEDTFRGAIDALSGGDAVQIYPEGRSHSEPGLAPLRTGAARIALGAESEAEWRLGLRVVPIGLTFYRKSLFRGQALAVIGEPFEITAWRSTWEADPAEAVRGLTDEMAHRLAEVTLNTAEPGDAELIDTAERLYAREKGAAGWRERDRLATRMPRLQAFARGLAWLRSTDPARFTALARAVRRYRRRAERLGALDGDVPPNYAAGDVAWWVIAEALLLVVAAPAALVGTVVWYPTYAAPRFTIAAVRPEAEAVATWKLATAFAMVPLTVATCVVLGALVAGAWGAVSGGALAVALGFTALAWHDRWGAVREDATLFFRLLPKRELQLRQAEERARLVSEFDALVVESSLVEPGPRR